MASDRLASLVSRALGADVLEARGVGGGDIAQTQVARLSDGREVFVKSYGDRPAMLEAEARGLRWLAQADAVRLPKVLVVGDATAPFLVLERVACRPPAPDHDEALGRGLAALHRHGAPTFGLDHDNFVGDLPQPNQPTDAWATFYVERRLRPLVRRAAGQLGSTIEDFEGLFVRMAQRCGPVEPPARLHGDLWAGNAITDDVGQPVLIDPAVYGGHREIDLAMMKLFGGFGRRCFDAYDEAFPLAAGWRERIPLYQLYPLLVHVNLFGGGYVGQVRSALRAVV